MISEPELVGDLPAGEPPETLTHERDPSAPRARGRRPWLWAAGGAVCASALWAGGLYVASLEPVVDTRGYTVGEGLCDKVKLEALRLTLGKLSDEPIEAVIEDAALDKASCTLTFGPPAEEPQPEDTYVVSYHVEVVAELHKKADPEPEFEAIVNQPVEGNEEPSRPDEVSGLGERAFSTVPAADYEALRLKVLDGGAVLELQVTPSVDFYGDEEPLQEDAPEAERAALPPLMVEDMRDLMTALKR